MKPVLPKGNDNGAVAKFRKDLYEDLYPQNQSYSPPAGGVTASSVSGSIVRMGRLNLVSVTLEAPVTIASGGYFDLPFSVFQAAAFCVAVSGDCLAGVVNAGEGRVYLPAVNAVGRVVISGAVAN